MTSGARGRLLCVSLLLIAVGCGDDGGSRCTVGQSIACACTDGRTGAQVCQSDGRYGVCSCTGPDGTRGGDAGADDAATVLRPDASQPDPGPRRIFVTALTYRATAAPEACQNAADAAGLGGTWVPWLSRRYSTGNYDAIDQIESNGPFELLDGRVAFANRAQLGTVPSVPIDVTEHGQVLTEGSVWTGTLTGGTTADHDCQAWGENDDLFGARAGTVLTSAEWTESHIARCDLRLHVYCVEQ